MNILLIAPAETSKPEAVSGGPLASAEAVEQSGGFALLLASLVGTPPPVGGDGPAVELPATESETIAGEPVDVSPPASDIENATTMPPAVSATWLPEDLVAAAPAPLLSAMMRTVPTSASKVASETATAETSATEDSADLPRAATSLEASGKVNVSGTAGSSDALPLESSVDSLEVGAIPLKVSTVAAASKQSSALSAQPPASQEAVMEPVTLSATATPIDAAKTEPVQTGSPTSVVDSAKVIGTEVAPKLAPVVLKSALNVTAEMKAPSEASPEVVEEAEGNAPLRALPKVATTPAATEAAPDAAESVELPLTGRQEAVHTARAFAQAAMASFDPESKPSSSDSLLPDPSAPRSVDGSALRTDAPQSATRETAPATSASALASTAPADPVEVPAPEVGRFALRGVRQMLEGGEQRMMLKVLPESLGEVQIEVIRNGNDVQVRMSATTQNVREMLDAQTHTLREALAREGFDTPRIQVTLQSPGTSSNGGHWNDGASHETRQQHQPAGQGPRHGSSEANQTGDHAPRTAAHLNGSGALNVTV